MTKEFLENLKELKKFGVENKFPNISNTLGKFLNILIKNKKIKTVLEIGTANGYSTLWIAEALKSTGGSITTFEISIPSYKLAQDNFKKCKLDKYINSYFCNFFEEKNIIKNKKYDLIFIDAQKNRTIDFFNKCKKLIKKDGIIIIDDVIKYGEKMGIFNEYMEKQKEFNYVILPIDLDDGIMFITKK